MEHGIIQFHNNGLRGCMLFTCARKEDVKEFKDMIIGFAEIIADLAVNHDDEDVMSIVKIMEDGMPENANEFDFTFGEDDDEDFYGIKIRLQEEEEN